jgi:hypothetical protein
MALLVVQQLLPGNFRNGRDYILSQVRTLHVVKSTYSSETPVRNTKYDLSHYDKLRQSKLASALKAWIRVWKKGYSIRIPGYVLVTSRLRWNGLFVHVSAAGWPAKAVWRREEQNVFTPDEKRRPISQPYSPQPKYQTHYAFSLGSIFRAPNFYFNLTILEKQYVIPEYKTRHATVSVHTSKKNCFVARESVFTFNSLLWVPHSPKNLPVFKLRA